MSDSNTPNTQPDTDDLEQFTLMFNGQEQKAPEETEVEPKDEIEVDTLAEAAPEEDEGETEAETEEVEAEAPKPKKTAKDRIVELNTKLREAERREQETARRLEAIEAKLVPEKETKAPAAEGKPTPTDTLPSGEDKYPLGEYDPNYHADLARFTVKQELAEERALREKEQETKAELEARQALTSEWAVKLEKAKEVYEDLGDTNAALEETFGGLEPRYGEYLATTIMSLPNGVDVLHYLGNNIEEAKKIVSSGHTMAVIALGRLDARFDKPEEKEKPQPKVTKAPAPPPQVTKGTAGRMAVPPDTDNLDAFSEMMFSEKAIPKKARMY